MEAQARNNVLQRALRMYIAWKYPRIKNQSMLVNLAFRERLAGVEEEPPEMIRRERHIGYGSVVARDTQNSTPMVNKEGQRHVTSGYSVLKKYTMSLLSHPGDALELEPGLTFTELIDPKEPTDLKNPPPSGAQRYARAPFGVPGV